MPNLLFLDSVFQHVPPSEISKIYSFYSFKEVFRLLNKAVDPQQPKLRKKVPIICLMREGYFITFHKIIKTQVKYNLIYSG